MCTNSGVFRRAYGVSTSFPGGGALNLVHPGNARRVGADSQADPVKEPDPIRKVPLAYGRGSVEIAMFASVRFKSM